MKRTIPLETLVHGVNQETEYHRSSGTVKAQDNCYGTHLDGIRNRHPLRHLAHINAPDSISQLTGKPLFHVVDRGPSERYAFIHAYKHVSAWDLFTGERVPILQQGGGSTLESDFTYLAALKTAIDSKWTIDQKTPEDLSNNMGSTQESESSGAPDTTKSWKSTATVTDDGPSNTGAITTEYSGVSPTSPGPLIGKVGTQLLRVLKTEGVGGDAAATRGTAFIYYRFVQTDEGGTASAKNKFPGRGIWTVISAYVKQEPSGANNTPNVELAIHDLLSGNFHRAKWTFTETVLNLTPTITGSGVASAEKTANGYYRIQFAHLTTAAEETQQRRVGVFFDIAEAQIDRRVFVHGFLLEEKNASTAGDRFWNPNESGEILSIQDYNLFLNRTKTAAMKGTTAPAKSPTEEVYFWVKNSVSGAGYKISLKAGSAKCKVGSKVYNAGTNVAPNASDPAHGPEECVGYTVDKVGNMNAKNCECAGTGTLQDYKKGLYVGPSTAPNTGMLRVPVANTETVALNLAFKDAGANFVPSAGHATLNTASETYPSGDKLGDGAGGSLAAGSGQLVTNGIGDYGLLFFLTEASALAPFDLTTTTWPNNATNTVEVSGSIIRVTSATAFDEVEVWDSFGGSGLTFFRNTIDNISELPKKGPCKDGFRVRVKGNTDSQLDDYFLKFVADQTGAFGAGHWEESTDYAVTTTIDETTMPHQLIRLQDDSAGTRTGVAFKIFFEWGPLKRVDNGQSWDLRIVGDDTLNPKPSFIGARISSMTLAEGRLWLSSKNTPVGSRVNNFFNFWRKSARIRSLDDVLDLSLDSTHGYPITALFPYLASVLAFDKKAVMALHGTTGAGIHYQNVDRRKLFDMDHLEFAKPVGLFDSVFVAEKRGDFSALQELRPSEEAQSARKVDATDQAPQYIDGTVLQLASSSQAGMVNAVVGSRYFYPLKITESGGRRVQQAISRSDLGSGNKSWGVGWIEDMMYVLVERETGFNIEHSRVVPRAVDSAGWLCCLDRRVDESVRGFSKSFGGGNTTIQLPYLLASTDTPKVVNQATAALYTIAAQGTALGGAVSTLRIDGVDLTGTPIFVGIPYLSTFTLNLFFVPRQSASGAQVGRISDRTQITSLRIAFEDTYEIRAQQTIRGVVRPLQTVTAPSSISNTPDAAAPFFESGVKTWELAGKAQECEVTIFSSDHRHFVISKAEFDADIQEDGG